MLNGMEDLHTKSVTSVSQHLGKGMPKPAYRAYESVYVQYQKRHEGAGALDRTYMGKPP
jgi:hypothetical protein